MMKSCRLLALFVGSVLLGLIAASSRGEPQTSAPREPQSPTAASHPSKAYQQPAIVFVQAPMIADTGLLARFPQGSRLARTALGSNRGAVVILTPEFFAAVDPQISFNGSKVLFAAQQQPTAHWQIWEMNAEGSAKRQVTNLDADCLRPGYLAHEEIVFTVVSSNGGHAVSQVYVAKLDGTEAHPITFGPGNFQFETVLKDGRILVSAASPLVPAGPDSAELYTLRHDGTGLSSFRCEHGQPARRAQAAELDDGSVVFVKSTRTRAGVGGELALIRRGALHNSTLSPLAAMSWSPRPLAAQQLIVARKNSPPAAGSARFDLYAFDSVSGTFGELIYHDPKLSSAGTSARGGASGAALVLEHIESQFQSGLLRLPRRLPFRRRAQGANQVCYRARSRADARSRDQPGTFIGRGAGGIGRLVLHRRACRQAAAVRVAGFERQRDPRPAELDLVAAR